MVVPVLPAAGSLNPSDFALAAVPLMSTCSISCEVIQAAPGSSAGTRDVRRAINRVVIGVVDPLDDVGLFPDPGVRENRVGRGEILQIGLERANVNRRPVRNVFSEPERRRDFRHVIEPGDFADADAHRVARMNQSIGNGLDAAVSAVGISRRPIPRALDFARLNRSVADRRAGRRPWVNATA